jgi:hypothetical protein
LGEDYRAGRLPDGRKDVRWFHFPSKIYVFRHEWQRYKHLLRILGEEDNINLLIVATLSERFATCRAIFVEKFAVGETQEWTTDHKLYLKQSKQFVEMCYPHATKRNYTQAYNLSRVCSHSKEVTDLLFRVIEGNYDIKGNYRLHFLDFFFSHLRGAVPSKEKFQRRTQVEVSQKSWLPRAHRGHTRARPCDDASFGTP